MRCLVTVCRVRPLTLHFALHNDAGVSSHVPRLLGPLGAFISVAITNLRGESVFKVDAPKTRLKLDPSRETSYFELEAGYSYGVVLDITEALLAPGKYNLDIDYSNGPFQGTSSTPVGVLEYRVSLPLRVGGSM